jgi:sialate O-acetylesterase
LNIKLKLSLIVCSILLAAIHAGAQIRLPKIICNNMVLERNQAVPIWGWAGAGKTVSVKFGGQQKNTVANSKGSWKVILSPLTTSAGAQSMVITSDTSSVTLSNILVGEVWICAGQSNMNFTLGSDKNGSSEIANLNNDRIREYRTDMPAGALNPENKENSQWISAIGKRAENFSAVAYYLAKKIQAVENVPIGLIVMSCGNTRVETWTDTLALKKNPDLQAFQSYWETEKDKKRTIVNFIPGKFYNDVVVPVIPFAAKGVIWYQGESNALPDKSGRTIAERTAEYKPMLKTLIANWRDVWNRPNMPFYLIQLPNYVDHSGDIQWAKIRQAQLETMMEVPKVSMSVNVDLGSAETIHPTNKQPVGERVARWVLANEYHYKTDIVSGPIIKNISIKADKAVLNFNYTGKGLVGKDSTALKGFEIADASNPDSYVPASAVVKGKQVIVWGTNINNPVAVRYAWADNPQISLYNRMAYLPLLSLLKSKA